MLVRFLKINLLAIVNASGQTVLKGTFLMNEQLIIGENRLF